MQRTHLTSRIGSDGAPWIETQVSPVEKAAMWCIESGRVGGIGHCDPALITRQRMTPLEGSGLRGYCRSGQMRSVLRRGIWLSELPRTLQRQWRLLQDSSGTERDALGWACSMIWYGIGYEGGCSGTASSRRAATARLFVVCVMRLNGCAAMIWLLVMEMAAVARP